MVVGAQRFTEKRASCVWKIFAAQKPKRVGMTVDGQVAGRVPNAFITVKGRGPVMEGIFFSRYLSFPHFQILFGSNRLFGRWFALVPSCLCCHLVSCGSLSSVSGLYLACHCPYNTEQMSSSSSSSTTDVVLMTAPSKTVVSTVLTDAIVRRAAEALEARGRFTIALSGGSLPSLLTSLPAAFRRAQMAPHWSAWHVLLADERCVPRSNTAESNGYSIQHHVLNPIHEAAAETGDGGIPPSQVYGIVEHPDSLSTDAIATDYQAKIQSLLPLDVAVLGFGPDGHTCSLFPHHDLLQETTRLVAPIDHSPKPPPRRITLTLPVLNQQTRHVIFCGLGSSKATVLQNIFQPLVPTNNKDNDDSKQDEIQHYKATLQPSPTLPCAMVQPQHHQPHATLTWIVDSAALEEVPIARL